MGPSLVTDRFSKAPIKSLNRAFAVGVFHLCLVIFRYTIKSKLNTQDIKVPFNFLDI